MTFLHKDNYQTRPHRMRIFYAGLICAGMMFAFSVSGNVLAATSGVSGNYTNGSVLFGYNGGTCDSSLAGALRYNSATGFQSFCNGTSWVSVKLATNSTMTDCVNANKGVMRYNTAGTAKSDLTHSTYVQVCDGFAWNTLGISGPVAGSNTQIQYNNAGALAGSGSFMYYGYGTVMYFGDLRINGVNALRITGSGNPIVGNTAMSRTLSPQSVAVGRRALAAINTEVYSVGIGNEAGYRQTSGANNTSIGFWSAVNLTTGSNNTSLGSYANGGVSTTSENTAIGNGANGNTNSGINNTMIGNTAGPSITSGSDNVAIGRRSLYRNTSGSYNAIIGGTGNSSGSYVQANNTGIGGLQGLTTASSNTALGYSAGNNITSGSNNIIIGRSINAPSATGSNQINIGNTIYGDTGTGRVSIGSDLATGPFIVTATATQTVGAGNTVTANSCGSVKLVTLTANRTTSTTNTFTTPSAANAGCCMDVINVSGSAFTLTLDQNANFKTASGANVLLAQKASVRVCSNGSAWFQASAVSTNS